MNENITSIMQFLKTVVYNLHKMSICCTLFIKHRVYDCTRTHIDVFMCGVLRKVRLIFWPQKNEGKQKRVWRKECTSGLRSVTEWRKCFMNDRHFVWLATLARVFTALETCKERKNILAPWPLTSNTFYSASIVFFRLLILISRL